MKYILMKYKLKAETLGAAVALALLSVMPLSGAQTSGSGVLNQIGNQFGARQPLNAERAEEIFGKPIMNAQGERAGKLDNLVVDLDSGRVLYAIVTLGGMITGETILVPPGVLTTSGTTSNFVFNADNSSLTNAPRWKRSEKTEMGSVSFVNQIYEHFGMKPWWTGGATTQGKDNFSNAELAQTLIGSSVKTSSGDTSLGTIKDLVVDVPAGWTTFAVVSPKSGLAGSGEFYTIPTTAITKSPDGKIVAMAGLDSAKLGGGPHFKSDNWPNLSDRSYAQQVYQYYGKQPGFLGGVLSPTGR
jgi:sporulation protein YlmC with PRC-barrel domain